VNYKYFLYDDNDGETQLFKTKEELEKAIDRIKSDYSDEIPPPEDIARTVYGEITHQAVFIPTEFKKDICTCETDEADEECDWTYDHDFDYVGMVEFKPLEEAAIQRKENRKNNVTEIKD